AALLKTKKRMTAQVYTAEEVLNLLEILGLSNKVIFFRLLKAITTVSVTTRNPKIHDSFIMAIIISMQTTAFRQWLVMSEAISELMAFMQHLETSTQKNLSNLLYSVSHQNINGIISLYLQESATVITRMTTDISKTT